MKPLHRHWKIDQKYSSVDRDQFGFKFKIIYMRKRCELLYIGKQLNRQTKCSFVLLRISIAHTKEKKSHVDKLN